MSMKITFELSRSDLEHFKQVLDRARDAAQGLSAEQIIENASKVLVKVKVPRKSGRGIESDLYIQVPENSSIDVGTVSADIEVEDVRGEQRLNTVSGDINTESAAKTEA